MSITSSPLTLKSTPSGAPSKTTPSGTPSKAQQGGVWGRFSGLDVCLLPRGSVRGEINYWDVAAALVASVAVGVLASTGTLPVVLSGVSELHYAIGAAGITYAASTALINIANSVFGWGDSEQAEGSSANGSNKVAGFCPSKSEKN